MHQSDQTQDSRDPAQDYVLGNGVREQNRLQYQAAILEKWTGQFFVSAGIQPGMKVLDLGCGMGDVSLLTAKLVGPTGSVIAIDRDRVILEKARERAHRAGMGATSSSFTRTCSNSTRRWISTLWLGATLFSISPIPYLR